MRTWAGGSTRTPAGAAGGELRLRLRLKLELRLEPRLRLELRVRVRLRRRSWRWVTRGESSWGFHDLLTASWAVNRLRSAASGKANMLTDVSRREWVESGSAMDESLRLLKDEGASAALPPCRCPARAHPAMQLFRRERGAASELRARPRSPALTGVSR